MDFKNKKYVLIFVLSVFVCVTVLLGGSYALIQRVLVGSNTYSITTGDFLVEFSDSNQITLSNQVPVYDNVGIKSGEEFAFSVTNTGNYISSYSVKIVDLSTENLSEVVRYAINYGDGYRSENIHTLANNPSVVQNRRLEVGGTHSYKMRFWLDIDASELYINKVFSAKIVIEATQEEYKYGSNILDSVYELENSEGLKAVGINGLVYTSGDIREYRYSGADVNNYVWFNCDDGYTSGSNHCEKWRIIGSFENTYEDGVGKHRMLKIVRDDALNKMLPFNSNEENKAKFAGSSIEKYLNETYYNSFSSNTKKMVTKAKWNIGEAVITSSAKSGYIKETFQNSHVYDYVGLINASDFAYAAIDSLWTANMNVANTFSSSNNWLYDLNVVVMNSSNDLTTYSNYILSGGLTKGATSNNYAIKPVVYLRPDVSIINGFGTFEEPYEVSLQYPVEYGSKTETKMVDELYDVLEAGLSTFLLADDGDERIVAGTKKDVTNNYVWYSGKLWRVVALNNDGSVKIMTEKPISALHWGSNNDYQGSWFYQWLNEDFLDTLYNYENLLVLDYGWDATKTTALTKAANPTIVNAPVGSLNIYEYVQSYTGTSALNGHLNNSYYWQPITAYDDQYIYLINGSGEIITNKTSLSYAMAVRPAINLKEGCLIRSGDGSISNPYTIVGDIDEYDYLLNERVSGEYVNFNNELYRIVSVDYGITKLTKVDNVRDNLDGKYYKILASTSTFGSPSNSQTDSYWDYFLNNTWLQSISESYRQMMVESTYYLGMVAESSYKNSLCSENNTTETTKECTKITTVFNGLVGTGRVGEMFASHLTDDSSYVSPYWLLTKWGTSSAGSYWTIGINGYGSRQGPADLSIRPSITLSNAVYIIGGDGTYLNPFEIAI